MTFSDELKLIAKILAPLAGLAVAAITYKNTIDKHEIEIGDLKAENVKVVSDLNRKIDVMNDKLAKMYELQTNIEVIKSKMDSIQNVQPFKYKVVPQ